MHISKGKELPIDFLHECFSFDPLRGELIWNVRPEGHFKTLKGCRVFNSKCSGKPAGSAHNRGYLAVNIYEVAYLIHRVCWAMYYGQWPDSDLDHINGNKSDNRIENLRAVTRETNSRNQKLRSNNSTSCMGVTKDRGAFRVRINVDGKRISVGSYPSLEDAIIARKEAERKHEYHENHGR